MNEAAIYGIFCRQLAVILKANVSPYNALQIALSQIENKKLRKAVELLVKDISGGDKVSDAMKQQGDRFPMIIISGVEGAERNGKWEETFNNLADYFENEDYLLKTSRKATIVPAIMIFLCIFVLGVIALSIVPGFMGIFNGIDFTLPVFTQKVVDICVFLKANVLYVIFGVAVFILICLLFSLSKLGRSFMDYVKMKLPLSGGINRNMLYSQFCKYLETLLKNGMSIEEAARVIEDSVGTNEKVRGELHKVAEMVASGQSLSKAISDTKVFSPLILQMTAIGEESGNLIDVLGKMSDFYLGRVGSLSHRKSVSLETIAVLLLGIIMCIVIGSMIEPMLEFYEMIGGM